MQAKKSAVEQRRGEIDKQLKRLRSQLARKSPKDFSTDFRYRTWLERTNGLIATLIEELSALNDAGEYDELPAAVIADELGLRLDQIRHLIKLGEVEATGPRAHPRVARVELERLARLAPEAHLALAAQDVEQIFAEAIGGLKAGNVAGAQRCYNRIKARETCIGDHALALEIAVCLVEGRYEDARRIIGFILGERIRYRDIVYFHLICALRGVHFKSEEAKGEALRLLKLLGGGQAGFAEESAVVGDTELTALYVAAAAQEAVRELAVKHLPPAHLGDFTHRLRGAVFTALYALAHAGNSVRSMAYLAELEHLVPRFWEPLHLLDDLNEE